MFSALSIRRRASSFRNYQVAAPLKPVVCPFIKRHTDLPQLSSCGPIEAIVDTVVVGALPTILPQLSSCGPIEAASPIKRMISRKILPQLSSCGPIESPYSHAVAPSPHTSFASLLQILAVPYRHVGPVPATACTGMPLCIPENLEILKI